MEETQTACQSIHERVTEARKRHRPETDDSGTSDCEDSASKLIKTCVKLQCSFCNKVCQCDPEKKRFTSNNCKCEQELNSSCCDGKLKLIPYGFHSHLCLECNSTLERCDCCDEYVQTTSINGILHKCESCNSVLVKCDCDNVLICLPEIGKKVKCRNDLCKSQIINCNCDKVYIKDFQNAAFWDCECGMKFLKNNDNGTLAYA